MRKTSVCWFIAVLLCLMVQGGAWAAVSIWWIDAGGSHTVTIASATTNPEWNPADPYTVEPEYCWEAVLDITMDSFNPITFTGSGNYIGPLGQSWNLVRIKQNVTNSTDKPWTDFHLGLVSTEGSRFYKVWGVPQGYQATKLNYTVDYVWDNTCAPIQPGQVLEDGIYIKAKTDSVGSGTFHLTKYPTYVPEASTAALLLSGGLGLFTAWIRRRSS